jgi:hypothetical protein
MFIRWQSRQRQQPSFGRQRKRDTHWSAILAESVRVDGAPVQRHIAYLGGITESAIKVMAQRCHYWDEASEKLDRLGNRITPADRERIEAAIAEKVPRPTRDEYMDQARRSAQSIGWEWLSKGQRAALQDEAERWQNRDGVTDEGEESDNTEAEINPDARRIAFLLRADQARLFAKYTGPIDEDVLSIASEAAAAWALLVERLRRSSG